VEGCSKPDLQTTYQDYNRAMTEKPSDTDPTVSDERAAEPSVAPELADVADTDVLPSAPPEPPEPDSRNAVSRPPSNRLWFAWVLFALLAAALVVALWIQRQEFDRLGRDLAGRIDSVTAFAETARRDADQALALARSQAAAIQGLQTSLANVRSQYQALQDAWEPLLNGSNAALLNDVEQLLAQANQQLRLGGNVGNAIIALEIAQARLASADSPGLAPLQQAIDADLSNLRAVPLVDVAALAARVDQLIDLTGRAPLLAPDSAVSPLPESGLSAAAAPSTERPVPPADAPWWQRLHGEIVSWPERALAGLGREMSGLISIRRVDDANALLLAPDQAEQLRATLRMRLLTAQVALLMRQPAVWRGELAVVSAALASNYDGRSLDTVTAVQIARELGETNVVTALPDLGASLKAIAASRAAGGASSTRED